jgi:phosphoribosylglycinamide formyltransferase 1
VAGLRVGVLISGRGSNLNALLADLARPGAPARIVTVISNNPDAGGLAHAGAAGVPATTIDHRAFSGRPAFDAALTAALEAAEVELICLAGFMRVLGDAFIARWSGQLINIHPSLLPAYRGLHPHERAIADGAVESGCTVHAVTTELDGGPTLAQRRVPVFADDSAESLAARILEQEHKLYPHVVRAIAEGSLRVPLR